MALTEQLPSTPYVGDYINKMITNQAEANVIPAIFSNCLTDSYVSSIVVTEKLQLKRTVTYTTSSFNRHSMVLSRILKVLINTIESLKLTQDYNGTYIAYLSGQLTEDEFLNESSKYSYSPSSELTLDTIQDIKFLIEVTKLEFSPSEIAEIFKLDHELSLDAIKRLNIPMVER